MLSFHDANSGSLGKGLRVPNVCMYDVREGLFYQHFLERRGFSNLFGVFVNTITEHLERKEERAERERE